MAIWLERGASAMAGSPWLIHTGTLWRDALIYVLPVSALSALMLWRAKWPSAGWMRIAVVLCGVTSVMVVHNLYRQLFGIDTMTEFVALGIPERIVWQSALGLGGVALMQRFTMPGIQLAGRIMLGAAILHFLWFGLLLHNPLWDAQAVGSIPLANLLPLMYGVGLALVYALRNFAGRLPTWTVPILDAVTMGMIVLLGLSLLRQIFAGSILTSAPMGGTEDLLRSLLGIVLAIAFLLWGSRRHNRNWRIGSLVVILMSVLKVFIVDAAGLEGLLRIASFMALGFSLIGIGWVYSKQLKSAGSLPEA